MVNAAMYNFAMYGDLNSLGQIWWAFDRNGDGAISQKELATAMKGLFDKKVPKKEIKAALQEADVNGDGQIT
jgi:Ca2+-binding EF-hand superfamily protein